MEIKEYNLQTKDNIKLYTKLWLPDGHQKAGIIVIHSVGDHSGRYENIPGYFLKDHFVVLTYDLRGHGKSEGKRGHVSNYSLLLNDLKLVIKYFNKKAPNLPLFLYGHGMGGALALNHCVFKSSVDGVIVTSLWLKKIKNAKASKLKWLKFLSKVLPNYRFELKIKSGYLTQDCDKVDEYRNDSYVFKNVTVTFFKEVYLACLNLISNRYKINLPVLLMHGNKDKISSFYTSKIFASNTKNINCKIWDNMYHELHNEPEHEQVFEYVKNWLYTIFW